MLVTDKKITLLFVILQLIVGTVIIAFPYLNPPIGITNYLFNFHIKHIGHYVILFMLLNCTYFYFIPKFYFKKKFINFIILLLIGLLIIVFFDTLTTEFLFKKKYNVGFRFHLLDSSHLLIVYTVAIGFKALGLTFNHSNEKKTLLNEKQKAELAVLRHQLSPHFLFNTLNNISQLMHVDINIAEDYIGKLSLLLRTMLRENNSEKTTLKKEIEFITNYVELQKIRLGKNNTLDYKAEGEIGNYLIEPFIMINFIENVFKHGLGENNSLLIHLTINDSKVNLHTKNKISSSLKDEITGIGINNVRKRLTILYPNNHNLIVLNNNNYFEVKLELSL